MTLSSETEKQVIEAILKKNEVYYSLGIEPRDFQDRVYRAVFETIGKMIAKNITIDEISLNTFNPELSSAALGELSPVTAANAQFYATQLREQTIRRDAELLFKDALRRVQEERVTTAVISDVVSELVKISEHRSTSIRRAKDIAEPAFDEIRAAYDAGDQLRGVPSGFNDIDQVTDGFRNGEVTIIASRPSIGKTTLALNMADHIDAGGQLCGFFSAEMSETQIMQRLFACSNRINLQCVRSATLTGADFSRLGDAMDRFTKSDMWIDDTPSIHFNELRNKARIMKVRGVEIIFIDFLTLINYGDPKTPKWERVGNLVRELKALARELNIPIVALSQLGRQAEGKEPSLADLRQSGEIEEAADVIMLMHREREEEITTVNIAKNRNGPTQRIKLMFIKTETRFEQAVRGTS